MASLWQAADVAAHIIDVSISVGQPISNLQLQKLLFYCQCDHLRQTGKPLFDDDIIAWQYGPVVKDVYYAYSYRGASDIMESNAATTDNLTGKVRSIRPLEGLAMSIVDSVCEHFRGWSAWDLVRKSHEPGGAWYRVYNNGGNGFGYGDVIPTSLMKHEPVR